LDDDETEEIEDITGIRKFVDRASKLEGKVSSTEESDEAQPVALLAGVTVAGAVVAAAAVVAGTVYYLRRKRAAAPARGDAYLSSSAPSSSAP
jgi:hypothetical protein